MLKLFYRLIVRPLIRDISRTALLIFAVALGVAVVLAIDLAGTAAAGSFRSSVESLTGDADFEVSAAGGVPDAVAGTLATLPYAIEAHPRIEDYATILRADGTSSLTVPLIGVDVLAGGTATDETADRGTEKFDERSSVWLTARLGFKTGDTIHLQVNDQTRNFKVRGIIKDSSDASASMVVMDIAAAQRELNRPGRLDRILVKVPSEPALDIWQARLREALPDGITIAPQGSRTQENRRMLGAFRWNLRVLSYIALVVGAFLIYNTISVSVVRRRSEIGIVRALGAGRNAILAAFLGEAVCLGLLGSLCGLLLGRLMAEGAVGLLAATVESLYVSSTPAPIELSPQSIALALIIGTGVAVISALSPAREAAQVSPIEAMGRGQREFTARVHKWRDLIFAGALAASGALAAQAPAIAGKPPFGYLAAVLFIGASAFAIPAMVDSLAQVSGGLLRRLLGVEALLASRSLAASLRRTSVLVGALATAIAMMTAVGIMVGSFRQTVLIWMDNQLQADLYLRPAGPAAADRHPTIGADLADGIERIQGVAAVDRFRAYEISYQGLPATLGSADTQASRHYRRAELLSGRTPEEVYRDLGKPDTAIVSEPFANKHKVKAGDTIELALGGKKVRLRILDVYYDYANERGYVILDRASMLRYLPDPAPSNIAVYIRPGASLDAVKHSIETYAAGRNVVVFSNRGLRAEAIKIFDRTFAITYALEAVAVVVAVMGIAGALLALVIDRRREFGLLRFLGAGAGQVRKLILVEAGLIGILANVAGLALGAVLSLLLIFVINKQSFGWTIQFHWPTAVLIGALTVVYAATLLAGLYPARVAVKLNPIEVVHED